MRITRATVIGIVLGVVLLAVVADKTGYPPEMLDLDMGLDADLGIDSIKRVEILSALQEQLPEAPAVKRPVGASIPNPVLIAARGRSQPRMIGW